MANVLSAEDEHKVRIIDSDEKNKFKFDWLERKVKIKSLKDEAEVIVGRSIKKIDVSGKATCTLCCNLIYYGNRGFVSISDHIKSKKHSEKEFLKLKTYSLPSYVTIPMPVAGLNLDNVAAKQEVSISTFQPEIKVPLCDRVTNLQSLVLGVVAEHNLPFTMAPVLIDVSKVLSSDKKALNHLQMARTTASYKMKYGVAKTFKEETVNNLKTVNFSLNIDEATSNNSLRVLCVLASYYSSSLNKVVVEHLESVSVVKVSACKLFEEVSSLMEKSGIPWKNIVSILMDSCNVMRGSKNGLEVRIRKEKAPHLLDIDGDSCHHVHNGCKKFCKPFESWVEGYLRDLHNDMKWSADLRENLAEICLILGVKYTAVENIVLHRWLSCYDVTLHNLQILDCLTLLYYGFLSKEDKVTYFSVISDIYAKRNVSTLSSARKRVKSIHSEVSEKCLTADGKRRKERITQYLFHCREKTLLIMNFYVAVLPLLKKYVCLFQTKEPLIHKIYDAQKQLFLDFLACFIKQEFLNNKSAKELSEIDLSCEEYMLAKKNMFLGAGTESIISKARAVNVNNFLEKAAESYVTCATYLQKTLPLNSVLLKCISAIDPTARGHHVTLERLKKLPELVSNVLSEEEKEGYALQVHQYQVDMQLQSPLNENGDVLRIDVWWSHVFKLPKYCSLSKMVKAVLSCFHGPQVESAFSMMNDIIDKESGNINIETYSAIQTVKYKLLSTGKSSIEYFCKKDHLHEPIDPNLGRNMKGSYRRYKENLDERKKALEEKKRKLDVKTNQCSTKKEMKMQTVKSEAHARFVHNRKRKLEQMVKEIRRKKEKKNMCS